MYKRQIPAWVTNGLTIAGGMLPVVGIGMLLRYMPVKKYLAYLLAGFVLAGYLKVPILGIEMCIRDRWKIPN